MKSIIKANEVFALLPSRTRTNTKHDFGKLLAIAGSSYYRGAAYLACASALRTGVGICTLAAIEKVISSVSARLPECTYLPLDESKNGTVSEYALSDIGELSGRYSALLIGCGLAIDDNTKVIVENTILNAQCRLIIDADGLNILAEDPQLINKAKYPPVITPHFNEMARLCHTTRAKIEEAPEQYALAFAKKYNCFVVLKSHVTYIATPDSKLAINNEVGNVGLARGGSGDLLAGMIASFCAQGLDPFSAAKCGVYIHGKAADLCSERLSKRSMLPSDILDDLSRVFID